MERADRILFYDRETKQFVFRPNHNQFSHFNEESIIPKKISKVQTDEFPLLTPEMSNVRRNFSDRTIESLVKSVNQSIRDLKEMGYDVEGLIDYVNKALQRFGIEDAANEYPLYFLTLIKRLLDIRMRVLKEYLKNVPGSLRKETIDNFFKRERGYGLYALFAFRTFEHFFSEAAADSAMEERPTYQERAQKYVQDFELKRPIRGPPSLDLSLLPFTGGTRVDDESGLRHRRTEAVETSALQLIRPVFESPVRILPEINIIKAGIGAGALALGTWTLSKIPFKNPPTEKKPGFQSESKENARPQKPGRQVDLAKETATEGEKKKRNVIPTFEYNEILDKSKNIYGFFHPIPRNVPAPEIITKEQIRALNVIKSY